VTTIFNAKVAKFKLEFKAFYFEPFVISFGSFVVKKNLTTKGQKGYSKDTK